MPNKCSIVRLIMFEIYDISQNMGSMVVVILISSFLCLAYAVAFFKKDNIPFISSLISEEAKIPTAAVKTVAIFIHLLFVFLLLYGSSYFVVKVANSTDLRVQPDGQYCYYVEATNHKGTTYVLPAHIYKIEDTYTVEYVYFNNGGYLDFGGRCSDFLFEETKSATDQSDKEWKIKLTNLKTSHPDVEEKEIKPTEDDYCRFAMAFLQLFSVFLHIKTFKELNKETTNG